MWIFEHEEIRELFQVDELGRTEVVKVESLGENGLGV